MLNHNLDHLEEIKDRIIYMPLEEQAKYADHVCIESINHPEFIKEQMDATQVNDISLFKLFNTTSVGNLAYLALNATKEHSDKAKEILNNYKKYVENK